MADNTELNPGAGGDIIAADEINGVKYQRIKVVHGADGESAGDVSKDNPLPVHDGLLAGLFRRVLLLLDSPRGFDKSLQRQRGTVVVESGTVTTVTTVTTVSTVANLSTIDTLQGRIQVYGANLSAWQDCVRSRIS